MNRFFPIIGPISMATSPGFATKTRIFLSGFMLSLASRASQIRVDPHAVEWLGVFL
jgi:hypothetical protein